MWNAQIGGAGQQAAKLIRSGHVLGRGAVGEFVEIHRIQSSATKIDRRMAPPTNLEMWPLPVVSSTSTISPGPTWRVSPSPAVMCTRGVEVDDILAARRGSSRRCNPWWFRETRCRKPGGGRRICSRPRILPMPPRCRGNAKRPLRLRTGCECAWSWLPSARGSDRRRKGQERASGPALRISPSRQPETSAGSRTAARRRPRRCRYGFRTGVSARFNTSSRASTRAFIRLDHRHIGRHVARQVRPVRNRARPQPALIQLHRSDTRVGVV